MSEIAQLITTIKHQLKQRGLTYRDVGAALELSQPSVKRLFSSERFTVERLAQVSQLLGFTLAELMQEAESSRLRIAYLTKEQEQQLVSNDKLLLVAVCALNHWSPDDMVATYRMTRAECLKHLLALDRIGLIELLPGDRVRLRVARDFNWLPEGPIRQFFVQHGLSDFIRGRFAQADETMEFVHGMLTAPALAQLQLELTRLRSKLDALHRESAAAPLGQRRGVGMLMAMREWEPDEFKRLRRAQR